MTPHSPGHKAPSTTAMPGTSAGTVSARCRILIADDDQNCRDLITIALTAPGTQLLAAANGGELLEVLAEHGPFDLIVTDIDMPWMQGLQVLASCREAELQTPVLVVTGLSRPDLPAAVAKLGRSRLLTKPFTVADLRAAIAELVGEAADG